MEETFVKDTTSGTSNIPISYQFFFHFPEPHRQNVAQNNYLLIANKNILKFGRLQVPGNEGNESHSPETKRRLNPKDAGYRSVHSLFPSLLLSSLKKT
jgi:hypothetical protein